MTTTDFFYCGHNLTRHLLTFRLLEINCTMLTQCNGLTTEIDITSWQVTTMWTWFLQNRLYSDRLLRRFRTIFSDCFSKISKKKKYYLLSFFTVQFYTFISRCGYRGGSRGLRPPLLKKGGSRVSFDPPFFGGQT